VEISRRRFVTAAGALGTALLTARAYGQAGVRRIGVLSPDSDSGDSRLPAGLRRDFVSALRRLGYHEGRNLAIEWRWANGRADTLPALAQELVALNVELIVARTNGPIVAAMKATRAIPIVMLNGNYPVESGLIRSLARPGGNVTGTSYVSLEFFGKGLQVLKDIAPKVDRVAILWDANWPRTAGVGKMAVDSIGRAAKVLHMTPLYFDAATPADITAALDKIATSHVSALFSPGFAVVRQNQKEITEFALDRKLASMGIAGFADDGGLADYSPDVASFLERTVSYVDRILKGAKPADLPVEEPTKYNLVINMKTAKAIALTVGTSALLRADRVIE